MMYNINDPCWLFKGTTYYAGKVVGVDYQLQRTRVLCRDGVERIGDLADVIPRSDDTTNLSERLFDLGADITRSLKALYVAEASHV